MLGFQYNLHITGDCEFMGQRINLDLECDNTGVNTGVCGKKNQALAALSHAVKYDVHIKGFVSIVGVKVDVDKDFHSDGANKIEQCIEKELLKSVLFK